MNATISAVSFYLPKKILSNTMLAEQQPLWPMEKIEGKTGIQQRHIAADNEFSTDMGIKAARKLLTEYKFDKEKIDFILFCSQTPKHLVPSNACIIHAALRLGEHVGSLDVNQGCSGYVYSLMLANGLIQSGIAQNILLVTASTYTKLINKNNRTLVPIFGDAATASLIANTDKGGIKSFIFGSDGSSYKELIAPAAGMMGLVSESKYEPDLYMNGSAIFNFTLDKLPSVIDRLLDKENLTKNDIDLYVFHQANAYMLEHLRDKIGIEKDKFFIDVSNVGNTVSSSIPIAIKSAIQQRKIKAKDKVMLVGFGVGLSWSACILDF